MPERRYERPEDEEIRSITPDEADLFDESEDLDDEDDEEQDDDEDQEGTF